MNSPGVAEPPGEFTPDSAAKEKRMPLAWTSFATPMAADKNTFGYRWNTNLVQQTETKDGPLMTLPEYFHLVTKNNKQEWIPVRAEDVPAETGLAAARFERPAGKPSEPYVTPDDAASSWKKPGPAAGPFQAQLGDGSVVTYYWYRFADQPALLNADLTDKEREAMQRAWKNSTATGRKTATTWPRPELANSPSWTRPSSSRRPKAWRPATSPSSPGRPPKNDATLANVMKSEVVKRTPKNYDAIIVGGGHNGLVAASYLARAGKSVLLLEAQGELGGATTSVNPFPEYEARLSRYSYLVSLLPDQIVTDLGLNFKTLERSVASYTPYHADGRDDGLLVSTGWDETTASSFRRLTGSDHEGTAWREFYGEIAELARRFAPSMLQPLKRADQLKSEMGLPEVWRNLMEVPIGEVIRNRFSDDLVRGVVLTDALIGTFVSADDLQANRCFLYHLIGNGIGQWRVPQGGMGALVSELSRIATLHGAEIKLGSRVTGLESGPAGVRIETKSGEAYVGKDLLFAAAPQHLARLRGLAAPASLEGSQLKINMLLSRLPRPKSGVDPRLAFAGTFHVNQSYSQLESAYATARRGELPRPLPLELYCHTLTDPTILSAELISKGYHTLTLFGFHTPAQLFDANPEGAKALAREHAIASLNQYLLDPIESVLAPCRDGSLAIEVKSPLDLEIEIALPRGNIFHRDLDFPFLDRDAEGSDRPLWGAETDDPHIYLAGAGARRGGGVSGIAGHNAAMALLARD